MTDYELKKLARYICQMLREEQHNPSDEWLTTREAADLCKCSVRTFHNYKNNILSNGKEGKQIRYSRNSVNQYLCSKK
jgi:phage terminase Nu1 subunit (DNA packaging protein)